jgi:hypothetical protein
MKPVKAMTVRLSPEQAEELETIATVDDLPVSEVVRAAIARHIDERRTNDEFREGLKQRIGREQRLLERDNDPPTLAAGSNSAANTRSREKRGSRG